MRVSHRKSWFVLSKEKKAQLISSLFTFAKSLGIVWAPKWFTRNVRSQNLLRSYSTFLFVVPAFPPHLFSWWKHLLSCYRNCLYCFGILRAWGRRFIQNKAEWTIHYFSFLWECTDSLLDFITSPSNPKLFFHEAPSESKIPAPKGTWRSINLYRNSGIFLVTPAGWSLTHKQTCSHLHFKINAE